jgi:Mg-chelatase subunit ChlD/uncharacterized membrane protein
MHLEAPWIWFCLPPLLVWVWWLARRSYAQLSPRSRWISAGLRSLILLCLLGAMSQPLWLRSTRAQHLIFALDVSRSLSRENLEAGLAEIDRLAREALSKGPHRISVVAFGRQPRLVVSAQQNWAGWTPEQRDLVLHESSLPGLRTQMTQLISQGASEQQQRDLKKHIDEIEEFRAKTVGDATDVRSALRLAMNTGEVGEARTIYLLTDANFNRGDWREAFDSVAAAGDAIRAVTLDRPIPPEVGAADLIIPSSVRANQSFAIDLRVASTIETSAKVVVYKDGYASAEFTQALRPGENAVQIPGLYFRDKGFHTIDVAVRAENDTRVENNRVRAMAIVPGELRVLYVDADEAQQSYLTSALALEGIQVQARPASGVPQTLDDLLGYDALILSNVPSDRLSARQMQMIRTYVQDFGGGFIMLGGDQSFGLGGYYATPIEEVLPVRMPIQKDLNRPSLAIILVIDKSGSMEGPKIQIAKRAAIATSEAINPRDQIGIVGFDSDAQEILALTSAGDRSTISAGIASLDAGGGTFLYPGLEIAHDRLQQSNARRKHVIVLSDGQTQGFGYPEMAQLMAADGITMSTVGIGEDADMKLLEAVAASGGGRAYFTNDFNTIPQIFTREALRASNSMLVERLTLPTVMTEDECIAELDEKELPPLNGYVATSPKEAAKVVMVSDSGDPILARWRTGLGRTAAFTSDTKPRWAEDWIRWPDFAKFWAQLIRGIAGHDVSRDISIESARQVWDNDQIRLAADLRDSSGNFVNDQPLELMRYDPESGAHAVPVERVAPGLFNATVPQGEFGRTQQFAWKLPDRGTDSTTTPFGFVDSYSPEFRTLGPDQPVLDQLRTRGVDVASVGDAQLNLADRSSTRQTRLWPMLLILALSLVPFDILARRLG